MGRVKQRVTALRNRTYDVLSGGHKSTIDTIRTAPPPSPLAPVNLTDTGEVHRVMDTAARIGDLLLAAGTGNTDAKAQIKAITSSYGLYGCHVDITLNTITIFAPGTNLLPPSSTFRVVSSVTTDFSRLSEVDRLIRSIVNGATELALARKILDDIETSPPPYRVRWATMAWGGFAGSVALMLGGEPLVAVIAVATSIIIMATNVWLASKSLPLFFQNFIGGVIATIPAALCYSFARELGFYLPPGLVIASCIVAMLAGLTLVQALQDGVTGAPVTSAARFFETVLMTGGIISGIGTGIILTSRLGMTLPPIDTSSTQGNFGGAALQVLGGVGAAMFFGIASFCARRALVVATFTALVAYAFYRLVLLEIGLGDITAAGVTAAFVGLAGGLLSRRYLIPPQITAIVGITPLLPGLALYRGMYSMLTDQFVVGISNLGIALATATALAAGVVLGEWVARRLRRPRILYRHNDLRRPPARRSRGRRRGEDGTVRPSGPAHWALRRRSRSADTPWLPDPRRHPDHTTDDHTPDGAPEDRTG
ncbi:MAG: threonine/serine exporter ThrE [Mycobacteriaceae bacterium]|uniref:threonine/serine exporter ThrE n=1 Tax=Corynebacterium sp. TaxID=1720 RepID=UPI003F99C3DE